MPLSSSSKTTEDKLPSFILSLCAFFALIYVYWPFLTRAKDFVSPDLSFLYQPVCQYIGEAFKHGRLPLWNDTIYTGMPQIAVISPGIFYPPNLLLCLLPFSVGVSLYMIFHQVLASASLYFYTRRLGIGQLASVLASICFGFGGYMFSVIKFPDYTGIAWIPTLVLMILLYFREQGWRSALALSGVIFSTAMLILAGRPENFLPGLLLAAVQGVVELFVCWKNSWSLRKIFAYASVLFLAVLCGVSLGSPLFLPEFEWLKNSSRQGGLSYAELYRWCSKWYDWLALVFWEPLGDLQLEAKAKQFLQLVHMDYANVRPFCGSFYMGPAYFVTLMLGMSKRNWKPLGLFLGLAIFWGLISAGNQTPFTPWLTKLFPQIAVLRYLVKFLIFPILLTVPVAAKGLEVVFKKEVAREFYIAVGAITAVLLVSINTPGLNFIENIVLSVAKFSGTELSPALLSIAVQNIYSSLMSGAVLVEAFLLCSFFYQRGQIKLQFFQLLTGIFLILPLLLNGIAANQRSSWAGFYEKTPRAETVLLENMDKSRPPGRTEVFGIIGPKDVDSSYCHNNTVPMGIAIFELLHDSFSYNTNMDVGIMTSSGWEAAEIGVFTKLRAATTVCADAGVKTGNELSPVRSVYPFARYCGICATEYVIAPPPSETQADFDPAVFELLHEDKLADFRLFRLLKPTPRIYFASSVQQVKNWNEFVAKVMEKTNSDAIDMNAVYTMPNEIGTLEKQLKAIKSSTASSVITPNIAIKSETPERVELEIQKKSPGVLVLRDQYYPGWRGFVDGDEVPIIRANMVNRAIVIPSGNHKIVFQYEPASLNTAFKITVVGLVGMLLVPLAFFYFNRERRGKTMTVPANSTELPTDSDSD